MQVFTCVWAVLEEVGLITTRRDGRTKLHHIDTRPLRQITQRWDIPREDRGSGAVSTAVLDDTCGNLIQLISVQ